MKKIFLTLILVLFVIPFGMSQDLPSNIPANGLVAYYPFNGNANDESGNSNNGNVLGASLSGDRFGNENSAYSFDGIDDFIVTQNSIASAKQAYTFSFWAKTENGTKNMSAISQNCDDDCDKAYSLVINKFLNSAIECEYGHMESSPQSFGYAQPAHYGIVNTITSDNVWKNYVLIVGADDNFLYNNFKFYVNGIQIDTNCNHNWDSWEYDFPNYPMVIGKGNNSIIEGFFNGQLDDVAVWNRALSFNEIKDLYDLPPGILLNGTISAENNQIKNVANPTESLDAVNLGFLTEKLNELTQKINELESLIDSPQVQPPSEYVLSFDANNYVRFPNIDNYDNLDSMTIEFWAYLNSSPCTDESIIGTEYFATGWHFYPGMWAMIGGPNNAEAISNVDAHGSCENYIESSKWFHIALQYNSELNENQWKLFIDGDLHEQKTGNISSIGDGGDIVINRHTWDSGSSSRLSGYIDEVRFSKIARYSGNFTPEIKQLQNDENTLLLLNFENTTSNQVIDSSTNQNHGIINGTVNYVLRNDIEDSNAAN